MKKRTLKKISSIIFGLFLCIILLETALYLGGLLFISSQEKTNKITIQRENAYRILCLGDSTTAIGGKDSWPSQLEEVLNNKKLGKEFSVINKGIVLADSTTVLASLEDNLNKYKPKMVIIMIGINDAQKLRANKNPFKKIKSFLKKFRTYRLVELLQPHIIDKRVDYISSEEMYQSLTTKHNFNKIRGILVEKGIKLVMMQYPTRSVKPLNEAFESERGIIFIDNEEVFKNALKQDAYKDYFMDTFGSDFGHATPKGSRLIAENVANTLLKADAFS